MLDNVKLMRDIKECKSDWNIGVVLPAIMKIISDKFKIKLETRKRSIIYCKRLYWILKAIGKFKLLLK